MKKLTLALSLVLGVAAFAEVPALINYQGRLVDGVGNPVTGPKEFKLDIYDAQTEGTLIYQETLPNITLDEDGAYSFQFGAGESRTETSEIIATGDGETQLFQVPLENTPIGPISVTDGTTTFTQGQEQTGEEPFTFLYVRGPNRINLVCNEPPAAGVSFTATYRYNEAGIVGALGTAAEHWMEVTIGGERQEPRQRLVAVPFALRAGVAAEIAKGEPAVEERLTTIERDGQISFNAGVTYTYNLFPKETKRVIKARLMYSSINDTVYPMLSIVRVTKDELQDLELGIISARNITYEPVWVATRLQRGNLESDSVGAITFEDSGNQVLVTINWAEGLLFDPDYYYFWRHNKSDPRYSGADLEANIFTTTK